MTKEEYQREIMRYSKQEIIEELAKMHEGAFEHGTSSLLYRLEQARTVKKCDEAEKAAEMEYKAFQNYRQRLKEYQDYMLGIAEREGIVKTDETGAKKFSLGDFFRVATKEEHENARKLDSAYANAYEEWKKADKEAKRKENEAWGK